MIDGSFNNYTTSARWICNGSLANEARSAEMAVIISYPTRASRIIILSKTSTKQYREFFPTLFVKTTDFQLVFNFEQTRTVTIFGEHGIMLIYHDGLANQSTRIALSNESVFNNRQYTIESIMYIQSYVFQIW